MARNLTYVRPFIYPRQKAAIFCPERYAVIEASTKSGKTHGCIVWLTEQAMQGQPGWQFWWVAPILDQSRIAYRRLKRALPRHVYTANETSLSVTLANDTTIVFKGADHPDSLYGDDVRAAVLDEATRMKEDAWHAVRTTLTATRGALRIIGNVKGRKNWAYMLARRAEAGEPDMHYARITAHDAVAAGVLEADEIEDARRQLPEMVFRELYLAEPSDDAGNPFGLKAISECVGPLSDAPPAVWGIDLAKSVDWTECIGLDTEMRVCAHERWQAPWESTIRRIVALTGETPALVDSTGVGDPVLEQLQRAPDSRFEGFKFSSQSKQQIMEGLAVAIQRQDVRFPDGVIRQQLENFEYVYTRTGVTYSAPEGFHDDAVCALALAVAHYQAKVIQRAEFRLINTVPDPLAPDVLVAKAAQDVTDRIRQRGVYWPGE